MKFLSLQPFVPSGPDYLRAREFFGDLGFQLLWDAGGYAGFTKDGCQFILQQFDNKPFAENFMISVGVENVDRFYQEVIDKELPQKYGIRITPPVKMPYGKESNLIDLAGVCWHFVE